MGGYSNFVDLRHHFQIVVVTRIHMYPDSLRFQVSTRSGERFSKICGYGLHIRAKRNRNKMFADSNEIKVLTENFTYKSKSIAWKFYLSK